MTNLLLIAGATLPLISSLTYVKAILHGQVRPQITTRFLLMTITILTFASLFAGHDQSGVWLALTSVMQSVGLWLLALKKGIGSLLNRLDMVCFLLCAVGVVIWLVSGQSLVGLIASLVADLIACVPSLVKTWRLPYSETITFYALDVLAPIFILLGGSLTSVSVLFPLYICLINAVFVVAIIVRRWQLTRPAASLLPGGCGGVSR